jgi:hypothetical protein
MTAASLTVVLAGVLLIGPNLAAEEAPQAAPVPPYLKGIDLNEPAQAAFDGWPSTELAERAYWLPWTTLSLQRAMLFNQPIFLVLTVPWSRSAQRMAAEALADPVVWRALNHDYLSLLVSADRRPDLYARYGTGNWPAISLLLPNGSPMLSQANEKKKALPISVAPHQRERGLVQPHRGGASTSTAGKTSSRASRRSTKNVSTSRRGPQGRSALKRSIPSSGGCSGISMQSTADSARRPSTRCRD